LAEIAATISDDAAITRAADTITIGVIDLPEKQAQLPLQLPVRTGYTLLVTGGGGSGRTSCLRTIVSAAMTQTAGQQAAVYAIDFSDGALRTLLALPCCGGVAAPEDYGMTAQMIARLSDEVRRRRRAVAQGSDLSGQEAETPVIVVVDGWDALSHASEQNDHGRVAAQLLTIATEGATASFTTVIAGGRGTLSSRIGGVISQRLVLSMADPHDYVMLGIPDGMLGTGLAGRGVLLPERSLVQIAHPGALPSEKVVPSEKVTPAAMFTNDALRRIGTFRPVPDHVSLADVRHARDRRETLTRIGTAATTRYVRRGRCARIGKEQCFTADYEPAPRNIRYHRRRDLSTGRTIVAPCDIPWSALLDATVAL
jgi:S-DNA-T family DNA segregation ATPase FtsK/SpoIIIE